MRSLTVTALAASLTLLASAAGATNSTPVYSNSRPIGPATTDQITSGATAAMTGTTSTLLLAAPTTPLRNYVTALVCGNSHATVGTFVNVQDGSGGTTIFTIPAAAVYGGAVINFGTEAPLKQPTAATGLYVVDATTGANVICSAVGFQAP